MACQIAVARSLIMQALLNRLSHVSPIPVMVRATLENALSPEAVNRIFVEHAVSQSQRVLLFSSVVEVMLLVDCRLKPSVFAAFTHLSESLGVSAKSLYNKLNLVEPQVSRMLVMETAQKIRDIINELQVFEASPIPGYEVRILDGNHHPASHHRLKVLRDVAAGPLPGKTLVVFDPMRRLVVDCVPCEDGHTQERAIVTDSSGGQLTCRLIRIELTNPTRDGDRQIQILSNLPSTVSIAIIAASYRDRWQVENVNWNSSSILRANRRR